MSSNKSNKIVVEPSLLKAVAEEFDTPLYVYDANTAVDTYRRIAASVRYAHTKIFYAAVANSNPTVLNMFCREGANIHANTVGDAWLALASNIDRSKIVLTGSNLTDSDLKFVVDNSLFLNVDSLQQLKAYLDLKPYVPPGVRVNLNCLGAKNRIGLSVVEVVEAVEICKRAGLPLAGLHFYGGTGTLEVKRYLEPFNELFDIARHIPYLKYVDVGGGFGFDYYDPLNQRLSWVELGSLLDKHMSSISEYHGYPIELWLEPGRSLVAESGILLTRVVDVKVREGTRYLGTDTSVANIAVLSVHGGQRRVQAISNSQTENLVNSHLCGSSTFSKDFLAKNVLLPANTECGDILGILDCGAYGYAMSTNFLSRPKPAEVLFKDLKFHLIRRRETYDDLLSHVVRV